MTLEEKAKAYDEAVKRAKAAIDMAADKDLVGGVVKTILPELSESESEDERIRKALIDLVSTVGEYYLPKLEVRNKMIDYLEKQKESLHIPETCKENADSFTEDERMWKLIKKYAHYNISDMALNADHITRKELEDWLEKQKEPENTSASTMAPSCWQKEQKPCWNPTEEDVALFNKAITTNASLSPQERAKLDILRMKFKHRPVIEQKEQKPIKWTDLTWKDIVELEGIINNVHYDFSAGIGQESFGKEVLERFRSIKGIEYLDEAEQKCWREEEQKPAEWSEDIIRKAIEEVGLTQHQINWFKNNVFPPKQEWSEEDEEMLDIVLTMVDCSTVVPHSGGQLHPSDNYKKDISNWLKSLSSQSKDEIYKEKDEAFKLGKHQLAIKFMNYLDENRPEGKMSLSNGECEDIDKAFKENDWAKIMRYVEKYSPSCKHSKEQTNNVIVELTRIELGDIINGLYYLKEKYYEDCKEHNGTATIGLSDEFKFYFKRFNEALDLYARLRELEKEKYGPTTDGYYYE